MAGDDPLFDVVGGHFLYQGPVMLQDDTEDFRDVKFVSPVVLLEDLLELEDVRIEHSCEFP